ncbi:neuroglian-like [Daphnia carinata]|uniref:neuroglian-like n=1 Tax=Daphnia carinata TaxID=120202 RepID=UPI0028689D2B|nr:neuroglian-like [Daphnia carinata]
MEIIYHILYDSGQSRNDSFSLEAGGGGSPAPEIKWIHNGKPIEETAVNLRRKVFPNRIVIERLLKGETRQLRCKATNSIGYVYEDVYLNVLALAPVIENAPDDTATVDGSAVNLTCEVFGLPKPRVKWIRDGLELTCGRYRVMDSGDLEIRDVTFTDAGVHC